MRRLAAIALCATLAAGCASDPAPDNHYYRVQPPAPERATAAPALDGVLEIRAPAGSGLLSDRALVYQPAGSANTLKQYRYHFWHRRPAAMIQRAMVDHLRAAGTATSVTTGKMGAAPDWVVGGSLLRFEHVLGDQPRVHVDLELEVHAGDGELVMVERYRAREPTQGRGPEPAVAALERALARVLEAVRSDLDALKH